MFFAYKWRRSRIVLFHLAENSHRFFHTNGKRSLSLVLAFFSALVTGCTFSRAYHRLHIFPRLAPVPYFPALGTGGTGYIFFRAWRRLHIFPLLAPATYFPALGAGYIFSRAWRRLHSFPRLVLVACVRYKFQLVYDCFWSDWSEVIWVLNVRLLFFRMKRSIL